MQNDLKQQILLYQQQLVYDFDDNNVVDNILNNDDSNIYLHSRPSLNDNTSIALNDVDGENYTFITIGSQHDREMKNCLKWK